MIKRTVTTLILMMGFCMGFSLGAQSLHDAPKFDPYLPGELNERALYALQVNDTQTALILLERAYRLNPNSPDIKANLDIVRDIAHEKASISVIGEVIYLDPLGNPASSESAADIPPLWPETKP